MKKASYIIIYIIIFLFALIAIWFVFYPPSEKNFNPGVFVSPSSTNIASTPEATLSPALSASPIENKPSITPTVSPALSPSPVNLPERDVLLDVPFTSQAPFGNWADPKEQDGCEEASALMAVAWARGEALTPQRSLEEILAISDYEEKNYGNYHDTNAEDTADRIYKGYFGYDNIVVRHEINANDIKQELFKGNLVVVPANGRELGNPHYTPPGPLEHNIVIRGYDAAKKEFITNDPGTSFGEKYRYKEKVLEGALMDYPTGYKETIIPGQTAMIIISR